MLVRHRNHTGMDSRALQRAAERGELIKLRSGAYVLASVWKGLNRDERIRLEVAAANDVHRGTFIASHRSAAALWGMPRIQKHDGLVHQRVSLLTGSRTEHGLRKHAVNDVDLHLDCSSAEGAVSGSFASARSSAGWVGALDAGWMERFSRHGAPPGWRRSVCRNLWLV